MRLVVPGPLRWAPLKELSEQVGLYSCLHLYRCTKRVSCLTNQNIFKFHFVFSIADTCRSYENNLADMHIFTCIGGQKASVARTKVKIFEFFLDFRLGSICFSVLKFAGIVPSLLIGRQNVSLAGQTDRLLDFFNHGFHRSARMGHRSSPVLDHKSCALVHKGENN